MTEQPAHQSMGHSPAQHRRLCFGGSFNPIHVGHLICARHAAEVCGLDGVLLVPTAANPHKTGLVGSVELASAHDRLLMCERAIAGDTHFDIDRSEISRAGSSYTFDTAQRFIARGDAAPIRWLVGTDLLSRLHTWHRFDEMAGVVQFVVMRRAGEPYEVANLDPRVQSIISMVIEVPQIEISSTTIRARVRAGLPIEHLVPPAVARYIDEVGLYR